MKNSLFIALLLLLAACKTPEVALDPSLTEPAMRVKRQPQWMDALAVYGH